MFREGDIVVYLPSRRVLVIHSDQNRGESVPAQDKSQTPSPILWFNPTDLIRVESEEEGEKLAAFLLSSVNPPALKIPSADAGGTAPA